MNAMSNLANRQYHLPRQARQGGFTLIEIMVVVVILGVLAGLVGINVFGNVDKANVQAAEADLRTISQALDMYRLDNHAYPTTEQGLRALVERPENVRSYPEGGYLKSVPEDPWGNAYQYFAPGTDGPFDLFSMGVDGREGGEGTMADIYAN